MSTNDPTKIVRTRRIAGADERQRMKDDAEDLETGGVEINPGAQWGGEKKQGGRRIQQARRAIKNSEVIEVDKKDSLKLQKRAAALKAILQKRMVPKSHINLRAGYDGNEFRKAVNSMAQQESSPETVNMADEYRNIQRILHPGDSDASSLERIRPDTR